MLAEKPLSRKLINQWPGLFSGNSPHSIPDGGGQVHTNVACVIPGVLQVRKGHEPVVFSNESTPQDGDDGRVIAMTFFQQPNAGFVVYQTATGIVKYGRR